jgi:hypothetical protein
MNQARHASPDSDIVLIAPKDVRVEGFTTIDIGRYSESSSIELFRRIYKHMSANPYDYELFCFSRWFYVLDYMREFDIDIVLHLDSDALLFSPIERIVQWMGGGGYECGFSVTDQDYSSYAWAASGHASLWTRKGLESFCNFILHSYRDSEYLSLYEEKWRKVPGICDMTALYLYWRENAETVFNTAKIKNGSVIDNNFNSSRNFAADEYKTRYGVKKVENREGKKYFMTKENKRVEVHVIHFQGWAKRYIPYHYQGAFPQESAIINIRCRLEILINRVNYFIKFFPRKIKRLVYSL